MRAQAATIAVAPKRFASFVMLATPTASEASCACRSPHSMSGRRTFCRIIASTSAFSVPRRSSFNGGMRSPSWNTSVAVAP